MPGDQTTSQAVPSGGEEVPRWVRRAIALFFIWAVGLIVAYWALGQMRTLLLNIAVALFLALAMEPGVNALTRRGLRRGSAAGLVMVAVLVGAIAFLAAVGSVAIEQASELVESTSKYVRNIVNFMNDTFGLDIDAREVIREINSKDGAVNELADSLKASAPDVTLAVLDYLFQIVTVCIFAFYLAADGPKLRRTICSRLPRGRQEIVLHTWDLAIDKTGAYLYSRSLQAIISGVLTWVFLGVLGVPSPLALGLLVGVVSQFIPTFGTYIALVLPTLVALLNEPADAIWVLAFLLGYQQFENYVLGPHIARYTLKIHPALTIGAVIAGGYLLGVVGAMLALPVTAVIQALLSTYTEEQEVIENELTSEPIVRPRRVRTARFSLRRRDSRERTDPKK